MKLLLILFFAGIFTFSSQGETWHVGDGASYDFGNLSQAAAAAEPGDTILIYPSGAETSQYVENLQGLPGEPINIIASGEVEFTGGNNAWHLARPAYLYINGFTFSGQMANGVNMDDGGELDNPAMGINIDNCIFRDIAGQGNNDLLKLSGLDSFKITNCRFENGSPGGSMVDMVGCHHGVFSDNIFINGGSNSIQAKGGTSDIYILRNLFDRGGARAINIGGSTGEAYFRPPGAEFESSRITVFANLFYKAMAPIAFVGTVNSIVANNTIISPEKWAIRILQENTAKLTCANNIFNNNIVYLGNEAVSPTLNIGANTAPETFTFSHNLWYNLDNESWPGPELPSEEIEGVYRKNPLLTDAEGMDISLAQGSPALLAGKPLIDFLPAGVEQKDFYSANYQSPPSIGAAASRFQTSVHSIVFKEADELVTYFSEGRVWIDISPLMMPVEEIYLFSIAGGKFSPDYKQLNSNKVAISINGFIPGPYFIVVISGNGNYFGKFLIY